MANSKSNRKPYKGKGKKRREDARAFRSGMESGDSIDKWDRSSGHSLQSSAAKANDWRWYAFNEQLLKDSASFAYSWPVGAKLSTGVPTIDAKSVPGIMAFKTVPSFGQSVDGTSAINTAARNIYSYVRHANAGHTNYDAPDLMLYLMAMDSIDSFISYMKRIYGVLNLYTYENRYYPDALLMAMGVDPADFRKHIADFRAFINMFIVRVGSMCVPNTMSYNARHMWMYDNIYVDSDTAKAQTYFYTPDGFYFYQLDSTGKGMLKFTTLVADDDLLTVDELEGYGLGMINPILTSEDMNIMSGDILKAFSDGGVIKRSGVTETYQCFPVYNEEVMSQFENITMMTPYLADTGTTQQTYSPNLYQVIAEGAPEGAEGYLYFNPSFMGASAFIGGPRTYLANSGTTIYQPYTSDRIINMHKNEVSAADTMVATRMANICMLDDADGSMYSETIGSDVCTRAVIWEFQMNDQGNWVPFRYPDLYTALRQYTQAISIGSAKGEGAFTSGVSSNTIAQNIGTSSGGANGYYQVTQAHYTSTVDAVNAFADVIAALSKFDWHPPVYAVSYKQIDFYNLVTNASGVTTLTLSTAPTSVALAKVSNVIFDIDKYAIINAQGLRKMSEVALLSMFSVPQMGAFARKL